MPTTTLDIRPRAPPLSPLLSTVPIMPPPGCGAISPLLMASPLVANTRLRRYGFGRPSAHQQRNSFRSGDLAAKTVEAADERSWTRAHDGLWRRVRGAATAPDGGGVPADRHCRRRRGHRPGRLAALEFRR